VPDVDINRIAPSGPPSENVINRAGPTPLAAVQKAPLRDDQRYRSIGRIWRSDMRAQRAQLEQPLTAGVDKRIREGKRLSRPDRTGLR
jgi:hypothetical protein